MRYRPQNRLGNTRGRKSQRLAGKPFQITVLAEMHHGIDAEFMAHPPIEREVVMRRHQIGRVICGLGVDVVAARRLHRDKHMAVAAKRQADRLAVTHRVIRRIAPARDDRLAKRVGQPAEDGTVGLQRHGGVADASLPTFIGRSGAQIGDERGAVLR